MNNDQMKNDQLQEDLTEVLRVRRDKLTKLQEMGRDPFKAKGSVPTVSTSGLGLGPWLALF